ncbi:serine/threonine-protein kinase [Nonomuraea aridisoli]|uniref:non-specific serine/threonine protein kinase n=1 Tax=Nonomuraea aridisoli TaxID=2070368 RepID=A0A2W2E3U6_9ACTN|nr:serine/threonine-protein kinase [Nonomuraea aridisoli]PZG06768.1 serine/threonine protein kinase [Nonomuraea aridisoli]
MPEQQTRLLADRYELVAPIGRGTMGTVWRARDRALGREVAVKEIRQDPGLTEEQRAELRERMVREGRIASRISHPSVASIHDVLIQDGSPWIIMELIEARSLEQVIDEEGPLPPRLVAELGVDLLGALRAAHAQGITHRDVKPANVLITESGRVVLTDFGIAKAEGDSRLTRTGMVIGSPGYTAPERARGEYTGPESDLWSLGATLYFAVEGRPAYERATVAETLAALLTENADPPTQAGQLRPVLNGLLNKDHRQRLNAAQAETMLRMVADTPTSEMPAMTAEALKAQETALPDSSPDPRKTSPAARPSGPQAPGAAGVTPQAARSGQPGGGPAGHGAPPSAGPAGGSVPGGPGRGPGAPRPGTPGPGGPHGGSGAHYVGGPDAGSGSNPAGGRVPGAPGTPPGPVSGPQARGPQGPGAVSGPQGRGPVSGPQGVEGGAATVPHLSPPGRAPQGGAAGHAATGGGGNAAGPNAEAGGEAGFDPDRTISVSRPKSPAPGPEQGGRRPPVDEGALTTRRVPPPQGGAPGQQVYPAPGGGQPQGNQQVPQGPYAGHGLGTDLFNIAGPPEQQSKGSRNGMLVLMAVAAGAAVVIAILIVAFITG